MDYQLLHNEPNPFVQSTFIIFKIPVNSNVEISVYNLFGWKLKTVTNQVYNSGMHSAEWDGSDETGKKLAGSIYLCILKSANNFIINKLNTLN